MPPAAALSTHSSPEQPACTQPPPSPPPALPPLPASPPPLHAKSPVNAPFLQTGVPQVLSGQSLQIAGIARLGGHVSPPPLPALPLPPEPAPPPPEPDAPLPPAPEPPPFEPDSPL